MPRLAPVINAILPSSRQRAFIASVLPLRTPHYRCRGTAMRMIALTVVALCALVACSTEAPPVDPAVLRRVLDKTAVPV